jgi:hypothetical protein
MVLSQVRLIVFSYPADKMEIEPFDELTPGDLEFPTPYSAMDIDVARATPVHTRFNGFAQDDRC